MNSMSLDQLKGAVRNMEEIANTMHVAMEELLKQHFGDTDSINVLTMRADDWPDTVKEFYLPSIDGRTVVIPSNRPDSLVRWKLHFFAKYGNLNLDAQYNNGDYIHVTVEGWNNRGNVENFEKYTKDKQECERSNAALYESMSK